MGGKILTHAFEAFDASTGCDVDHAKVEEHKTYDDHRDQEVRIRLADEDDDACKSHCNLHAVDECEGQEFVDVPHVLGKPVEDSSRGVGVEEVHGSSADGAEHDVVESNRGVHADVEEQKRAQ